MREPAGKTDFVDRWQNGCPSREVRILQVSLIAKEGRTAKCASVYSSDVDQSWITASREDGAAVRMSRCVLWNFRPAAECPQSVPCPGMDWVKPDVDDVWRPGDVVGTIGTFYLRWYPKQLDARESPIVDSKIRSFSKRSG